MDDLIYRWQAGGEDYEFRLIWIPTSEGAGWREELPGFYLGATPVTQAFWTHIMGATLLEGHAWRHAPQTEVSWNDVVAPGGFFERLNASPLFAAERNGRAFRLPREAEWEWAARGGPHWRDGFRFSGSNEPDEVAWYGPRWGAFHMTIVRFAGWHVAWRLLGRKPPKRTRAMPVAQKRPNQLGLYDMSGNVWEWCEDAFDNDGEGRRLRGGCHHNWDLHCTVAWRYGIEPGAKDGCIGLRVAFS